MIDCTNHGTNQSKFKISYFPQDDEESTDELPDEPEALQDDDDNGGTEPESEEPSKSPMSPGDVGFGGDVGGYNTDSDGDQLDEGEEFGTDESEETPSPMLHDRDPGANYDWGDSDGSTTLELGNENNRKRRKIQHEEDRFGVIYMVYGCRIYLLLGKS